jgi:stage IV sporulation protein B
LKFKKTISISIIAFMFSFTALQAEAAGEKMYIPMGCTVGIQLRTEGVLVVGLSVPEDGSNVNSPAGEAGIMPGDLIIMLDDRSVSNSADFISAIAQLSGDDVSITVRRGEKIIKYTVKPEPAENGGYKLGLWLRDGVSGIGTVTYYDPETGEYGALGHSINDIDTGVILPLGEGVIVGSTIVDIRKGTSGCPGELCGCLDANAKKGNILKNTIFGIFGIMDENYGGRAAMPAASEGEIVTGKATILTNVSGTEVAEYEVEIIKVYSQSNSGRSLMLSVTDPKLLELTGGIVQGMSGSPIIQNGKLIGAVTHVLINDPTKGYGVSISQMLNEGTLHKELADAA